MQLDAALQESAGLKEDMLRLKEYVFSTSTTATTTTATTTTATTTTTTATTTTNLYWDAMRFKFLPANVASGDTIGGAGSRRVTRTGGTGHGAAVMTPGVTSGVLYWKAKILAVGGSKWVYVGVVGTTSPGTYSYGAATSYGWANGYGGWPGWSANDEAAFKLVLDRKMLTMKHRQKTFQMTGLTGAATWYIHVNLHSASSVEIFPLQAPGYEAF